MVDRTQASTTSADTDYAALVAFLNAGAGGTLPADKSIETHAAQIFLIGEHAYKIKKPVNFGYLDFSTVQKRRWALKRELERNIRYAPKIYLELADVRRGPDGTLRFGGEGTLIDHVLVMRRFPSDALLSKNSELVCGDFAEELGRIIARAHAEAPLVQSDWQQGLKYSVQSNAEQLSEFASLWQAGDVRTVIEKTRAAMDAHREDVAMRVKGGFIRQCHGDLHLKNIFLDDGVPVLFDCIEFDDRLSDIDILYDLAFLVMDVLHGGQPGGANRLINGYLDELLRHFGTTALAGLALFPLYLTLRACVRAHVSARMDRAKDGQIYLHEALGYLQQSEPCLMAVGGVSGTGKTTFARRRASDLGPLPGAIVLRSDEIRKRLWGASPQQRLPADAYTKKQSAQVYENMFMEAREILRAGYAVILDAVFLAPEERARCRGLAEELGVGFEGCWLEAPAEILRGRITARRNDASDADLAVLEQQVGRDPGEIDWRRCDATAPWDAKR